MIAPSYRHRRCVWIVLTASEEAEDSAPLTYTNHSYSAAKFAVIEQLDGITDVQDAATFHPAIEGERAAESLVNAA